MMRFYKKLFLYIIIFVLVNSGCTISRSINSVTVGEQKVYFKRRVWGRNGDRVWITTDSNICHNESEETDYITNSMVDGNTILYKIEDKKIYVYGSRFLSPKTEFPIKLEIVVYEYDPTNPNRSMQNEGYQKMNLGNERMTYCFSDIF